MKQGRLEIVGLGISIPRHTTMFTESLIRSADRVFHHVTHPVAQEYMDQLNPNNHSLHRHYTEQEDRPRAYHAMADEVVSAVAAGERVVMALYGHPRVFAVVPKFCIEQLQELALPVTMHPGIGADACIYADLNLDPAEPGICHVEASQFLFYKLEPMLQCHLVLWQVSIAGDTTFTTIQRSQKEERQRLVDKLRRWYPADHPVCLYEAGITALHKGRQEWIELKDLAEAHLNPWTTAVLRPCKGLEVDEEFLDPATLQS
ncbi:SAM-dependent methyltransferase [Ferrimonas sp.]|uniref:SAM-dependent methyltransferase n=1 Tax=Ferrimonas sp. TaxID=2080861 RepID=UPI003A8DB2BB